MQTQKVLTTILVWLPSVIVTLFFIPNALDKIINSDQTGKMVENSTVLMATGIVLLVAVGLFLCQKTMLIGASLLASYMSLIACMHFYVGKPFEGAILLAMATVFAAYIRKPTLFHAPHGDSRVQ